VDVFGVHVVRPNEVRPTKMVCTGLAEAERWASDLFQDEGVLGAAVTRFGLDQPGSRSPVSLWVRGKRQQVPTSARGRREPGGSDASPPPNTPPRLSSHHRARHHRRRAAGHRRHRERSQPRHHFGADCTGWGPTCHTVFSRAYTKNVLQPAASGTATGLLASTVGVCVAAGDPPGGATCAAIFGSYSGASQAAISQAAAQNQCAAYTTYFTDAIAVWKTDFGPDCH